MKYAINLPNGRECGYPQKLAEFAAAAEMAGWDAIFVEDYILWQGHSDAAAFDPWISLAAMALSTKAVRLGTMVTPVARRRPWKLAREALSIDHLSGGRFILGVGVGDTTIDTSFTAFGEEQDARLRAEMLDEGLKVIVGLWSGIPFRFEGTHYSLQEVTFLPPPVQKPRIPIWVGGIWPLRRPTQRALRWDGACMYKVPPQEDWQPGDVHRLAQLAKTERDPQSSFDIVVGHASWQRARDPERERAYIASLAEAGATWWSMYVSPDKEKTMRRYIEQGPPLID